MEQPSPQTSFRTFRTLRWQYLNQRTDSHKLGLQAQNTSDQGVHSSPPSKPRLELGSGLLRIGSGWWGLCQSISVEAIQTAGRAKLIKQCCLLCPQDKADCLNMQVTPETRLTL